MALPSGEGIRLRVYLGEKHLHGDRPLYLVLLERLRLAGAPGASVIHGLAGFGRASAGDREHLLRMSDDVPIIVEVVDRPAREEALRAVIREVAPGHLLVTERVRIEG